MSERVLVERRVLVVGVETGRNAGGGVSMVEIPADGNRDGLLEIAVTGAVFEFVDLLALARDLDCAVGEIPLKVRLLRHDRDETHKILDSKIERHRVLEAACEEAGVECSPEEIRRLRKWHDRWEKRYRSVSAGLDEARAEAQRWKERAERAEFRVARLEERCDRLTMEAQSHAMEARSQRATVHECYRAVTQGRGEPADWNGAKPVVDEIQRLRAELDAANERGDQRVLLNRETRGLRAEVDRLREECEAWSDYGDWLAGTSLANEDGDYARDRLDKARRLRAAREAADSGVTVTGSYSTTGPAQMPDPQEVREWEERTGRKFDIREGTPSESEDSGRSRAVEPDPEPRFEPGDRVVDVEDGTVWTVVGKNAVHDNLVDVDRERTPEESGPVTETYHRAYLRRVEDDDD